MSSKMVEDFADTWDAEEDAFHAQELLHLKNQSQIYLIRYMIKKGVIGNITDFVKYAEVFDMMANGCIYTEPRLTEEQLKAAVEKVKKQVDGVPLLPNKQLDE